MELALGQKIRSYRRRDGRTQEELAEVLGVTSQAVSRWEASRGYPDMELIPAIANYFKTTIDDLFGYDNDREEKINAIVKKVNEYSIKSRSDDGWVDECLSLLREGLAEFPRNERLMILLADALCEGGYRRFQEASSYDENGYLHSRVEHHKSNEYWAEAIKICEYLVPNAFDNAIVTDAIRILVMLYHNLGENEKAKTFAKQMPEMKNCREALLASASEGREKTVYFGEYLLMSARAFANQIVQALMANRNHFATDLPIKKIKGAIALFHLICDDGNLGGCHGELVQLYLYLSFSEWMRGYRDDAFSSLDEALKNARVFDALCDGKERTYTAPLVSGVKYRLDPSKRGVVEKLPDDWPFWRLPCDPQTEKEIKSDPRWTEWVKRTKE